MYVSYKKWAKHVYIIYFNAYICVRKFNYVYII
jgi:hypothetical protein